ncbi:MAG: DUF3877 family protein [Clostridia bacterium]|nr:DUF3877 family protein [Clostridia bacterium]
MEMNFNALRENLLYVIKESQIKLGYTSNAVRLNYPLDSLNRFFGTELDKEEMQSVLSEFSDDVKDELGEIEISEFEGMFTLIVPPQGAQFVHENIKDSGFLKELIDLMKNQGSAITINEILEVFNKYSDKVKCVETENNDEFNYVVWFEDGKPDNFRYCIDIDLGHAIYHRLAPQDFEAYGF